jgi:hypothetical protein
VTIDEADDAKSGDNILHELDALSHTLYKAHSFATLVLLPRFELCCACQGGAPVEEKCG